MPTGTVKAAVELDWQSFSERYFPSRRRHDPEALTAYGAYRNGPADGLGAQTQDAALAAAAVQAWEAEGGSAQ